MEPTAIFVITRWVNSRTSGGPPTVTFPWYLDIRTSLGRDDSTCIGQDRDYPPRMLRRDALPHGCQPTCVGGALRRLITPPSLRAALAGRNGQARQGVDESLAVLSVTLPTMGAARKTRLTYRPVSKGDLWPTG